jgi:hypothetical protein
MDLIHWKSFNLDLGSLSGTQELTLGLGGQGIFRFLADENHSCCLYIRDSFISVISLYGIFSVD